MSSLETSLRIALSNDGDGQGIPCRSVFSDTMLHSGVLDYTLGLWYGVSKDIQARQLWWIIGESRTEAAIYNLITPCIWLQIADFKWIHTCSDIALENRLWRTKKYARLCFFVWSWAPWWFMGILKLVSLMPCCHSAWSITVLEPVVLKSLLAAKH